CVGQLIGKAAGFISANVHSSVSGSVTSVEDGIVTIENDKQGTLDASVVPNKPLSELNPEEIVEIVREKGITGMGGAGFPAYVKLQPQKPVDTVLINACECEPMLTADHRILLEYADDVIFGLQTVVKAVGAEQGVLVVEDNKPDAIALLEDETAPLDGISVRVVKTKYPQGAEKMLIKNVLGRKVPSGGLPADVGAVVCNASTAKAISDAVQRGMPLLERAVSVTGPYIAHPGNYMVKLGTNVRELVDACGGITSDDVTVKMGGPMMGAPLDTLDRPIIKGSNGIIAYEADVTQTVDCIKCGRCSDVCPMELNPLVFAKYLDEGNIQGLKDENILDCMECRCCEYICSSKIPLVQKIKDGKKAVKEMK
ncbi:MAG: RnfABCDGE type electron transport complex subunit C, partial [Clostridia bacterium]|nr:RnfABCDGE type electron transport complex subunit C [Clostridia bacterium]